MWWVIIVAIIITFVWWGSSSSKYQGQGGSGGRTIINGEEISQSALDAASREVRLRYFYSSGFRWPTRGQTASGFNLEEETYKRLLMNQKIAEFNIHVSDETVAQASNNRIRALNKGNPVSLNDFETKVLKPEGLTLLDFDRYIRNELGFQQLVEIVTAGADLVTPQEAERLYRREHQEVVTQLALFRATNDLNSIAAPGDKVAEFYTNRLAAYRLPVRLQINYVSYALSNFLASAREELNKNTNLSEIIDATYEQRGTNYFADAKTPAAAKTRIREEFEQMIALNNAGKEAKKLNAALYEKTSATAYNNETFAAVAKELGLKAEVSAPFAAEQIPPGFDVTEDFVKRAFSLSAENPLTEELRGQDHVYVIGFNRLLPSEIPALENIKARVTLDYRFTEATTKAQEAGTAFYATVTNGLGSGQSFAALCSKAGVKAVKIAPFSLSSQSVPDLESAIDPRFVQQFSDFYRRVAFNTAPGQVGPLLPCGDGAAVVFVQERLPVNESAMATNLPAFRQSLQQSRRSEVFNQWFSQVASEGLATVPYFQKKNQGAAAAK